ncbi:unnamed protein product [Pleuronectes platessa]|uniref:Uncharacterized protein n=1 Tax=Pleuronectes platessa TaxID=8262 RepID=A0A9N7V9L9_PLEPL|nr:unnamed protein product [Pleuronectes platessa]
MGVVVFNILVNENPPEGTQERFMLSDETEAEKRSCSDGQSETDDQPACEYVSCKLQTSSSTSSPLHLSTSPPLHLFTSTSPPPPPPLHFPCSLDTETTGMR